MTGQQLRNAILQEAIQGHLVPNVLQPGEKTGAELLKEILAERQKKENDEKGRKAKKLTLSIIDEEPWELPEGWCWCKLGDICDRQIGKTPERANGAYWSPGIAPWISISDMQDYGLVEQTKESISVLAEKEVFNNRISKKGSLIMSFKLTVGRTCILGIDAYHNEAIITFLLPDWLDALKLYLFWLLPVFTNSSDSKDAVKGKTLNKDSINATDIPLPPLSVQKAIVEKIEELFPLVEEYDQAAGELKALNEILPEKLRKSVLQEAIKGNLVPNIVPEGEATAPELLQQILKKRQDREDNKKGKKAKKLALSIIEDEPWDLPEGWCWCKLKDIIDFTSSGTTKNGAISSDSWILDLEDIEKETGRLLCKKRFGEVKSLSDKRAFKAGNVLYSKLRPYLNKCIIANEDGYCTTEILAFDFEPIYNRYAQAFLMSPYFVDRVNQGAAGVKMPRVNNAEANDTCFPLPPLSVQHRIVEKIEEVFSAINKLESSK